MALARVPTLVVFMDMAMDMAMVFVIVIAMVVVELMVLVMANRRGSDSGFWFCFGL